MAGFRLTLKKLAKKYGVDIEGATYAKVVQEIVNENVARASKKMGSLSNRRMKQAFADSVKNGIVDLPDYAIPNVTVRKGAEDGKMITDTLRDVLTRGLRKAVTDNPNDTEKAIAQMQSHIKDTFTTYTTSHAKMIAVTEVRSSVDLSKAEYVRELIARNPNKLRVTKKWIHNDHLVKIPRLTHKAIDGEKVLFNQPFSIGLMYPHDPSASASEVIGCQCGYQVEVEEMATNEIYKELKANINRLGEIRVYKASASINPATGKPYQIGETKVRPDGTKWVKTGTYSWAKAGTKDAEEAKKKTDSDGDGKIEKKEIEGQSSKDAEDILGVYGEKGLYQLTKAGMYNLLLTHGVDDPKSLKWAEKVEKVKEIAKEIQERGSATTIKTQGKEEFTEKDYHILHNSDLVGNVSSLENEVIHTRNGDVRLKFTEDGGLTDETYDELMQKVDPIEGGHWGSANTDNATALSVALVNAPDWKPIDKMRNGILAKYDQQLSDNMYEHCLIKGIGLRKHAQEALKNPDMSRENIPNFFRGMTVDASQYEQILAGEVDTIELTGCTAVTSFEAVADQYASSQWTRSFGAGRRSIKLVIERDDYMDNSIGMFHHNTKGYAHGNRNIGFELLTGSPSFYIKSVQKGGDFDIDKSVNAFANGMISYNRKAKDQYDQIKDVDLANIYNPNKNYWKYTIKDNNGNDIFHNDRYYNAVEDVVKLKAQSEVQDLNNKIEAWEKQFYKDNIQDFFSKIKNGRINHKNNDKIIEEWGKKVVEAWQKSDLYKQYSDIKDSAPYYHPINKSSHSHLDLPDEAERKKIDQIYSDPNLLNYHKSRYLLNPMYDIGAIGRSLFTEQFDRWRESQNSKKGTLTMKMFLDKRKPLEKSYKTQVDKTEEEYKDFVNFYKWRNQVMQYVPQAKEKIASEIKQKYDLTDKEMEDLAYRGSDDQIRYFSAYDLPTRLSKQERRELAEYIREVNSNEPKLTNRGIMIFNADNNPYINDELKKSPYLTKSEEYSDNRYNQLANMRKNYENAKRENELIVKYDIYNTPRDTITKMRGDTLKALKETRDKQRDYLVDKYNELSGNTISQPVLDNLKESYKKGTLSVPIRETIDRVVRDKLADDKDYLALTQELMKNEEKYGELDKVFEIYGEYSSKLADMHKSSRPLEVHVVCGRGKKSMTAGADDQLEEQDNDNNQ
jgi:hypothetical protein